MIMEILVLMMIDMMMMTSRPRRCRLACRRPCCTRLRARAAACTRSSATSSRCSCARQS